ncbi:kinesin-like protein KIN-14G [Herrania umbratica]|uniref:Kinesin-like protein KIN-14G n=1 Tax=Herrania umbratica TaxID=108875 RepID=A0A6J1A6C3_9ROSI|nr:kinesin-like protein KIN-14G [Herrania umbratica]
MATESNLQFSVISVLEDVLQQHGTRISDINLASRKIEESSLRRYEAAGWLRKKVGVVGGKDLPAEPSEEEFRLGLRSGIILCNVLNKVQPGAVPKVVEGACDSVIIPDGAALSAFQYFENVRNFLVAIEEMGIPTFEASDLEQGGKSSRIVNCVLALKSYSEWKQSGGIGSWKYSANGKPSNFGTGKPFVRKSSEPFTDSMSRTMSLGEKSVDSLCSDQSDLSEAGSVRSLHMLVRAALSDKKQEEIPTIVESMLNKVLEEFEGRLASQNELIKTTTKDMEESVPDNSLSRTASCDDKIKTTTKDMEESVPDNLLSRTASSDDKVEVEAPTEEMTEDESSAESEKKELYDGKYNTDEESIRHLLKQQTLFEQQEEDILELKHSLHATKASMQCWQRTCQEEFLNLGKHLHTLAYAASGYQRVLEENRKLYNQVQDLKGNIRVYCRVRPFLSGQSNSLSSVDNRDDSTITIITPSKYGKEGRKSFTFNKIFGPYVTQAEVFSDTQPLIRSVLDGYNVCIFAYGQTGSGKTYTMTGPKELTEEELGVNYRALSDLFLLSNQRKETISYAISVQMLEIYNEQVRDLLSADGVNKRLEIRNSSQNGINVPDASLVPVSSTFDVINLMNLGQKNRAVSATAMNDRSSRSHSCLTVHVQGKDLTSGNILRGSMHLVDLAGSERVDKSEVTGDRLKEAQHINKSLSALGDVIASLASKSSHVPYRNSKLTQLLQDSLGGQAKTLMFVHIAPEYEALGETISTLKFAERVATVELGAAKVNKDSGEVRELKEQIASLKAALARRKGEPEHLQHTQSSSPESRPKLESSASLPKFQSFSDLSSSLANTENDSSSTSRRDSLEIQEMLANPSLWPPLGSPAVSVKDDDRDSVPGDWVDKVMVKKHNNMSKDRNPSASREAGNRQLPDKFNQSYLRGPTKIYPEQNLNKFTTNRKGNRDYDLQRTRSEVGSTDDSDLEAATSDCSENDSVWQSNVPKITNGPNGLASKPKKQQLRTVKSTEFRSSIPSLIPSPSMRKSSNGVNPNLHQGKRKAGSTK